jgi:hypothetical protein
MPPSAFNPHVAVRMPPSGCSHPYFPHGLRMAWHAAGMGISWGFYPVAMRILFGFHHPRAACRHVIWPSLMHAQRAHSARTAARCTLRAGRFGARLRHTAPAAIVHLLKRQESTNCSCVHEVSSCAEAAAHHRQQHHRNETPAALSSTPQGGTVTSNVVVHSPPARILLDELPEASNQCPNDRTL